MKRASTHSPRSLNVLKTLNSSIPPLPRCSAFSTKLFRESFPRIQASREKAQPMGRASFSRIFTLYFQYINLKWVIGTWLTEIYLHSCEQHRIDRVRSEEHTSELQSL